MILSIVAILLTGLLAYIWSTRGFFNALVHMTCTIIAGAVAFAVWEPLAYFLLGALSKGSMSNILESCAWGLALAVPFALALAILRGICDSVLRANINVNTLTNYIGGGVCGLVTAVITTGMIIISASYLRMSTEFMGYQPYRADNDGSVVRKNKLWLPVDSITAGLYGALSERAFAAAEPLAKWHPDLAEGGHTLRVSHGDGASRNTIRKEEIALMGRWKVAGPATGALNDAWNTAPQRVKDSTGKAVESSGSVEGFLLNFRAGGGEKNGKVILGPAQVRLLVTDQTGEQRQMLFPFAVSSQAERPPVVNPDEPQDNRPIFARWRYDSQDIFISSVGGGAESVFGLEFAIPSGMKPVAIYVRGTRIAIDDKPANITFQSVAQRDAGIMNLPGLLSGGAAGPGPGQLDVSKVVQVKGGDRGTPAQGFRASNGIGTMLQLGRQGSNLTIDETDTKNLVVNGTAKWETSEVRGYVGLERPLRVENYKVDSDVTLVHIDVSNDSPMSLVGSAASQVDRTLAPTLVDANGQSYPCIGYWYQSDDFTELRYTPDRPISRIDELKTMSRSSPERRQQIIFRVTKGVDIKYFVLGGTAVVEFAPPQGAR
jgi:hypothetical protein